VRKGGGGTSSGGSGNTTHDAVVLHLQAALGQRTAEVEASLAQVAALETVVANKEAMLVALSATHATEKAALRARIRDLEEAVARGVGVGVAGPGALGGGEAGLGPGPVRSVFAQDPFWGRVSCPNCEAAQRRVEGMRGQLEVLVHSAAQALGVPEVDPEGPSGGGGTGTSVGGGGGSSSSSIGGSSTGEWSTPWLPADTPGDLAVQVEREIDKGSAAMVSEVVRLLSDVDAEAARWDRGSRSDLSSRLVAVVNRFLAHITALREALSTTTAQVSNLGYVCAAKDAVIDGLRHGLAHPWVDEYPAWPGGVGHRAAGDRAAPSKSRWVGCGGCGVHGEWGVCGGVGCRVGVGVGGVVWVARSSMCGGWRGRCVRIQRTLPGRVEGGVCNPSPPPPAVTKCETVHCPLLQAVVGPGGCRGCASGRGVRGPGPRCPS
jgi:hypothetical protein